MSAGSFERPGEDAEAEIVGLAHPRSAHVVEVGRPHLALRRRHESRHGTAERRGVEPAQPGLGAGPPGVHRVVSRLLAGEARALDLGRHLAHAPEAAPVERLDGDPGGEATLAHERHHRIGEGRGGSRGVGIAGIDLDLDVEAHAPIAGAIDEGHHVGQTRHAHAVRAPLPREARGVGRARTQAAHVVALQLVPGQGGDGGPSSFDETARRGRAPRRWTGEGRGPPRARRPG